MINWDNSLIENIHHEKMKEQSEDRDNLLNLVSHRLYGDKIHYVLELIQNADDEGASTVTFVFNNDHLAVINDGRNFNKNDVKSICSVKTGGKKNKIGFFGIGFKSVFEITQKPQIISNIYNFEISEYIYPKSKSDIPKELEHYYTPDKGAIFVLPYSIELSTPDDLKQNFNTLDEKTLLFLDNLEELFYLDNMGNDKWNITKKLDSYATLSLIDSRTEVRTKWKVFHHSINIYNESVIPESKQGIKDTRITIAFPMDNDVREMIKREGVIYCYLPTTRTSDLPFLIQADFLLTVGRENLKEDPWNEFLMNELGSMVADKIDEIKKDEHLGSFLYDFIPLSSEINDKLIQIFYKALSEKLREKRVVKTSKGWKKPKDCVIPDNDKIRDVVEESDLSIIFDRQMFYVDTILSYGQMSRAKEILLELGTETISCEGVIKYLKDGNDIQNKDKDWFLELYYYLSTFFDINEKRNWDAAKEVLYEELHNIKLIFTNKNKLVSLKDPEAPDRLICFPQKSNLADVNQLFSDGEIVFLHSYFQKSSIVHRKKDSEEIEDKREIIKKWFVQFGVRRYFKESHAIKEVILPKYANDIYKEYDELKKYQLIDYLRANWSTIQSEIENSKRTPEIIEEIKNTIKLKAYKMENGKKIHTYASPNEIYFTKRYSKNEFMEELFDGIDGILYLSSSYLDQKKKRNKNKKNTKKAEYGWKLFFEDIGVWSTPKVIVYEDAEVIYDHDEYDWIEMEYSTLETMIRGDAKSPDIQRLIKYCAVQEDQQVGIKRMKMLWDSLNTNWELYRESHCRCKYEWFFRRNDKKEVDTTFFNLLKTAEWVIGNDAGFYKPGEVVADINNNKLLLGDKIKYTGLKAKKVFLKDLGIKIKPDLDEVIDHLKSYRKKNPDLKENKATKIQAIYEHIIDEIDDLPNYLREDRINDIKSLFNEHELLYIPREDKVWWKPINVYWGNYYNEFGNLRGYLVHNEQTFYRDDLKTFLTSIGVSLKPSIKNCVDVLNDLKENGSIKDYKNLAPKIYNYIDKIAREKDIITIEDEDEGEDGWNRSVFLSEKGNFLPSSRLFYCDDDEYINFFSDVVDILWIDYSWDTISNMLQLGGFTNLSQSISIAKSLNGKIFEVDGSINEQIVIRLSYTLQYLKKNKFAMYEKLKGDVINKVKSLQAYEVGNIELKYILNIVELNKIIDSIIKQVYYSHDENRLYVSSIENLLSTPVAKELSKIFGAGKVDVFPIIDSLFSAQDEEELENKLKQYDIEIVEPILEEKIQKIKYLPKDETTEEIINKEEIANQDSKESAKKPQLSLKEPDVKNSALIDPNDYEFEAIEENIPYKRIDGKKTITEKTVNLKEGTSIASGKDSKPQITDRSSAEPIALSLVMRYEESKGRVVEDRHAQKEIGYDIYSQDKNGVYYIEVKHSREASGKFTITSHEWEKAKIEEDKYYIYVVSRLKQGDTPILEVIQNPVNHLAPDQANITISNWKNGVKETIKLNKKI